MDDLRQPTDEPTEADPECPESATADGCHCKCERGTCCWCGTDRPPTVTPFPLNDEPTRADECIAALRSWAEEERYTTTLAGHALTVLAELDRLRALVGARSAAPTREQVRSGVLNHLIAHLDSADPVVTPSTVSAVADLATDAVVALLSRSAAPTDRHDDGLVDLLRQLAATQPEHAELLGLAAEEVATLRASRIGLKECIVDLNSELAAAEEALLSRSAAEPPEDPLVLRGIVRRFLAGWDYSPELDGWLRVLGSVIGNPPEREVEPVTASEKAVLASLGCRVAVEPNEEHGNE